LPDVEQEKGCEEMKFTNTTRALRWAYETAENPIMKIGTVSEVSAGERNTQAALILSLCERVLPALHMAYVKVQFGREAAGFDLLTRHLAANFGGSVYSRRAIEQIIRAYCGEKIGLREIRKAMQCGTLKAAALRNQGYDALDLIHSQTMDILDREMDSRGLLRHIEEHA
jgi:hypothetical protein